MKRLLSTDVAYLDAERPNTPPLMAALLVLDPSTASGSFVRHRDILSYVEQRLHLAPNLRRRLAFNPLGIDEPRLIDDPNFDVEFHVRHLALPRPRDHRQLSILVARLMSRPMDLNRPLWEMYVIEGLENLDAHPAESFGILFKLHHAAFDGAAGLSAIFAMMQAHPGAKPDPPAQPWHPQRLPNITDWATSTMSEGFSQLLTNMKAVPGLVNSMWQGAAAIKEIGVKIPQTRFQAQVSTHRVLDWINLPMTRVQALRAALGKPKVNDLLLCLIGGALRAYLEEKKELPDQSLYAICPINVRGDNDPREGGNQITAMRVQTGTDIAEPLKRLAIIAESSLRGKEQAKRLGPNFMPDLMALTPYWLRSRVTKGVTALTDKSVSPLPIANFVVSNIPPPRGKIYFADSQVLEFTGFGPLTSGLGLFHTISGMDDVVSIAVNSDRKMMPDIARYMACLQASFEEMEAAATRSSHAKSA